jgi:16S rRNA (cytosine1402-N4)-methyltransferase
MIRTTEQLASIVRSVISGPHLTKSLARVFQAFRIAVNRELDELRSVLPAALSVLTPGGRLAVISYHSLEDRAVKWFLRNEANPPQPDVPFPVPDMQPAPTMKIITRRPVTPDDNEIADNPRARSAKLRVGEKL